MKTIFISYARKDKTKVQVLHDALTTVGGKAWWDDNLPAGVHTESVIRDAIRSAGCVIVAWSKQSVSDDSDWVPDEARLAKDSNKYVPVRIESGFDIPLGFGGRHTLDLSSWSGSPDAPEFTKLRESIERVMGEPLGTGESPDASQAGATTPNSEPLQEARADKKTEAASLDRSELADPLLSERLVALQQYLGPMTQMDKYVDEVFRDIPTAFSGDDEDKWAELVSDISRQVKGLSSTLEEIKRRLLGITHVADEGATNEIQELWRLYRETNDDSQQIFQESIELIGGLRLRGSLIETNVWEIADELIRFWARWTAGSKPFLTIPTPKETFSKTVRRVIHLRFPEWTIWNLPQTAHELGRVLVSEPGDLKDLIQAEADAWMESITATRSVGDNTIKLAKKWQIERLQVLAADAFATYTMGPAYACSAIMLRLDPSVSEDQGPDPAGFKRVHTILDVLQRMDRGSGRRSLYKDVIEHLEDDWKRGLEKASPGTYIDNAEKERLDGFIASILQQFNVNFLPQVRYSGEQGSKGWRDAQEWADQWEADMEDGRTELSLPEIQVTSKLRDALNAAWLCRLYRSNHVEKITEASNELCAAILDEQKKAKGRPIGATRTFDERKRTRTRSVRG